jgi:hypothetical protein
MTYQEEYAPFFERLSQYSNLSLLQQVFYEEDITSRIKKLFLEEKYVPTREDIKFVKNEYIREKDGDTGKDSILSHLSFIVFYIKVLDSGLHLSLVSKKRKFLLAILSLKEKRVIGYGYREVAQIVHQYFQENMLEVYYQYAGLILRAMEVYYGSVENFIEETKCGSFRKKWDRFKENNPPQDKTYNEIINAIFPDLNL